MILDYTVKYSATNRYEALVKNAVWQFLIKPEENEYQEIKSFDFSSSIKGSIDYSVNALGFETIRLSVLENLREIEFNAEFEVNKKTFNPFDFESLGRTKELEIINSLDFKTEFEPYLKRTELTKIDLSEEKLFRLDAVEPTFNQLQKLNTWVYNHIEFKPGVTSVKTSASKVLKMEEGVCQDFSHLFCAICRENSIPARYVSGYLHQGIGYSGDSQLHAWAECYVPGIGWVGFDPTNNLIVSQDHIKICHGKDYNDCSPLKGIIYATGSGSNTSEHRVQVSAQQ
ncbi:transglutaminase family protein [Galbibacter sp. BG1]|uniref:transglutaminase-like domain-containing protein n=1 Tax=Galbibacter sp. BG1 TaxID=1170699 RepID=UPI0015B858DB|nr:transglutaminase family protein [Galbibacter sp. BG1]QLE02944.1 transglutaminase family protein [Galbibacter sp. BG1]